MRHETTVNEGKKILTLWVFSSIYSFKINKIVKLGTCCYVKMYIKINYDNLHKFYFLKVTKK